MLNIILFFVALFLSVVVNHLLIPLLHQMKFGQPVLEDVSQHQKKQGLPTMGGISFIVVISFLGLVSLGAGQSLFAILGMLWMGLLGFIDDGIKVMLKRNLGLKASYKILGQIVLGLLLAYLVRNQASSILIPFSNQLLDLGPFYYPLAVIFIIAMTNSTNLTDGLDGLLTSVSLVVMLFFTLISWNMGNRNLLTLSWIFMGALLGFLYFNRYPARIIMGDTGSMAIGGLLAMFFLMTRTPLYALVLGIVYVMESLSVMLQVAYFKRTGKRIFKMAPLHHHFEMEGFSEHMIVLMFVGVTTLALVISLLIYWL